MWLRDVIKPTTHTHVREAVTLTVHEVPRHTRTFLSQRYGLKRAAVPPLTLVLARSRTGVTLSSYRRGREGELYVLESNTWRDGRVCFGDVPREVVEADPVSAYWNSTFAEAPVYSTGPPVTLECVLDHAARYVDEDALSASRMWLRDVVIAALRRLEPDDDS